MTTIELTRSTLHLPVPTIEIEMATAIGTGPTELAAFDAALVATGVANFNLIRLSSVIPPASVIRRRPQGIRPKGEWGDRLYVVYAEQRESRRGVEAWAGIGWVQDDASGKGLFVEHEGHTEEQIRSDIERSLDALCRARNVSFGPHETMVIGTVVEDEPTCAFAVAVFESASWRRK